MRLKYQVANIMRSPAKPMFEGPIWDRPASSGLAAQDREEEGNNT